MVQLKIVKLLQFTPKTPDGSCLSREVQQERTISLNGSQILSSSTQGPQTSASHLLKECPKYANVNQTLLFMFIHNVFQLFVPKKGTISYFSQHEWMPDCSIYKELDTAFKGTKTQLAKRNQYIWWCRNLFLSDNNFEISGICCNLHLCNLYWHWFHKTVILRRKI